jgi:hypothetical protein
VDLAQNNLGGGGRLGARTLPPKRAGEFYEEAKRGRSASHHRQVKDALSLLYKVLSSPNPFAECLAPKFAPEKTELRYHIPSQLNSSALDRESLAGCESE